MKNNVKFTVSAWASIGLLVLTTMAAQAAKVEDYISNPPFSTASVSPNVVVMLDNSGSMKSSMYGSNFDPTEKYYGIFQSDTNYSYDSTFPIDTRQYAGGATAVYDVAIDTSKTGAFQEDTTCTIAPSGNCWDGNFLNWLTTRRIDAARMVLVGGKLENRDGVDTGSDGISDYWKIVGNNEPDDRDLTKSDVDGDTLNPYVGASFTLSSPVSKGAVDSSGLGYDPYGKLRVELGSVLLYENQDISGTMTKVAIGEAGQTVAFDENWSTVTFRNTYTTPPVVVAGPMSYAGSDPSSLRVRNVTTSGFEIKCLEYEHKNLVTHNQGHTNEKAYYIAIESGTHQIIDGPLVHAGEAQVDESWSNLNYPASTFSSTPAVIATPVSFNATAAALNVRMRNSDTSGFQMRLQAEELDQNNTGEETVAYLGVEQGSFSTWEFGEINAGIDSVDDELNRGSFSNDISGGLLLASMQSFNGGDPAGLRLKDDAILVEEDTSSDTETGHAAEDVGYVHFKVETSLEFNVAVIVTTEPQGLMHDVYDDVRLGVSFYNYQYQSNNIYNGETNDGGTFRLKIPLNPFIKRPYLDDDGNKPTDSGFDATEAEAKFREIDTYVRGRDSDLSEGLEGLNLIVDAIEHYPLVWGTTPIAENLVEVANYFRQNSDPEYDDQIDYAPYQVNDEDNPSHDGAWDPFIVNPNTAPIDCLDSFVLIFTDGYPYKDACVPDSFIDYDGDSKTADDRICDQLVDTHEDYGNERNAEDNLDDVAKWVHTNDLRADIDGMQNLTIHTVGFAGGTIRPILQDTADNAGGQAYAAEDGNTLADILANIFIRIQNQPSSGTAAGVVSQSRTGVGAVYQALFFQNKDQAEWVGELQTLLIDDFGRLREDTNGDNALTMSDDRIAVYTEDGTIDLYEDPNEDGDFVYDCDDATTYPVCVDTNCNGLNDTQEATCNGNQSCLDALPQCRTTTLNECMQCGVDRENVAFLWKGSDWVNTVAEPLEQRTEDEFVMQDFSVMGSTHPDNRRYLFTFADADNDMLVDVNEGAGINEQIPFACTGCTTDGATTASLTDADGLFPYLTLYSSLSGNGDALDLWSFTDQIEDMMDEEADGNDTFTRFLRKQAQRLVNFTRGVEQDVDGTGNPLLETISGDSTYTIPAFRKRTVNSYEWRIGDAVYSTPTMVAAPAESYNLLYRDRSYGVFAGKYQNRRGVVYMGANDGIFRAFNAGFFRERYTVETSPGTFTTTSNKFWKHCGLNNTGELQCNDHADHISLGAELWGYIPKNLLPHLYWLTEPDYDSTHVYYNDLKPRVFDAKIFEEEAACSLDINNPACIHPGGWGTVLVGGMRLGGGEIRVDMDKANTSNFDTYDVNTDRTMSSAYFILDITNPEAPPDVLAELSFPGLGFTTCYPTAIPVRNRVLDTGVNDDYNKWFLVFGNGPNDIDEAHTTDSGKVYVVYLNDIGKEPGSRKVTLLSATSPTPSLVEYDPANAAQPAYAQELEANTFVSDPIAVDYDLDFQADAVYFGTVTGNRSDWTGKLRRIVIDNDFDATNWDTDNVMLDLTDVIDTNNDSVADAGQPITAAPSVALDSDANRWIFVGTGRYLVEPDEANTDKQSYYGVKEPTDPTSGEFTYGTVSRSDLFDVSDIWVYSDESVRDGSGNVISPSLDSFDELVQEVPNHSGWLIDFDLAGERNIGQAALLGEVLSFTTYVPPDIFTNPCLVDGESYLYGLFYETGTSFRNHIFPPPASPSGPIQKRIHIGPGVAISPNLHVGRDEGSKAILQTSTGSIEIMQQTTPGRTKSGKASWFERR